MSDKTLGQQLRWLRRGRDLTQDQVAKQTGVQARSLRDWEADKHMPSIAALGKLAQLYGVKVDSLVVQAVASRPLDDADHESAIAGLTDDYDEVMAMMRNANSLGPVEL